MLLNSVQNSAKIEEQAVHDIKLKIQAVKKENYDKIEEELEKEELYSNLAYTSLAKNKNSPRRSPKSKAGGKIAEIKKQL